MGEDGIQYEVIDKAAIPPPQQCCKGNFRQWIAIGRLLEILEPSKAVRVDVGGMSSVSVLSALYSMARGVGIRISTQRNGNCVYVVKRGEQPADRKPVRGKFRCRYCRQDFTRTHRLQEVCPGSECQKKRKKANNDARKLRVKEGKQ